MAQKRMKCWDEQFLALFRQLSQRYSVWQVWNDFLVLAATSLANAVKTESFEQREQEYRRTMERYSPEEQKIFPDLFACVVCALEENPEQDFMGEMYTRLRLSQHQKGQFFTPYHVCECMAEINCLDGLQDELTQKGYISVSDPACGAGATLLAFANVLRKHGINYQKHVLFVAQDVDRTAALMCYIQLSLAGCPACVVVGDSLAKPGLHPDNEVWYTLFYFLNAWKFRDWEENGNKFTIEDFKKPMPDLEKSGSDMKKIA